MALTLVKSSTIASGAAVSSQATSFASLPTAGNMIVVLVSAWRDVLGANIASVSDNQGNTYTKVIDRNGGNIGLNEVSIWYCASIGTPSGAHTVTANPTAGADNYIVVIASEVSGQDTSAPLDASTSAAISTTGDVATGTTGTLAQADEIVFIAASVSSSSLNIAIDTPATYTRIGVQQDSNTYIGFEGSYKIVAATTAVVGQWSHDNTGQDEASGVIATFKAAAGGASISAFQGNAFQGGAFQFGAIVSGGGGDATALPGVGSLTLTGLAGTVAANSSAAPGLQALVITGLAPTVAASSSAAPGIQALVLTGLAPTVSAGVVTTPGIQALALTGLAPTVTAGSAPVDVTVTPGAGELVLQGYDPTVTVPVDVTVSPALGALIFTGYAPTATGSSTEIVGSAGPSQSATVQLNRPRPSPAHEWELELAQAARLASIAKTMAKSERPQARRIAKKIADYTGEIRQAESLRRELAKLEAAQREKTTRTRDQISRDKELRRAANELQDILVEEEDAIQAIMDFDEYEAELMFLAFGFKIY